MVFQKMPWKLLHKSNQVHKYTMSLSVDKQADIIDAFNTTSRYLDDIFEYR